jgi:hypothetical protein
MSLIFVDNCECKSCIHNKVCNLKNEKKEIVNKISGKADNIVASTVSFKLSFSCTEYERMLNKRECIY